MARGGSSAVPRSPTEQSEGLIELDRVDSTGRRWRRFCISGHEYHVNMSVLEPYLQVLSHGGQRSQNRHLERSPAPRATDRLPHFSLGKVLSGTLSTFFSVSLFVRLLWRRDERHHPVHLLLPSGEHGAGLRLCHGQPLQVRLVATVLLESDWWQDVVI